jgi:asparagine synthase (glutamine-hydrolysing)
VTVSLSGDGGDELFLGYARYRRSLARWQELRRHPEVRAAFKCSNGVLSALLPLIPESHLKRRWRSTITRVQDQWLSPSLPALFSHRFSLFKSANLYLTKPDRPKEFFDEAARMADFREDPSWLSYLDLNTYLPDDLLVKVDRAAMAVSLETRMPMLDHRVVEFAAQIPTSLKLRDDRPKWPLRQVLGHRVPRELTERKKMGFSTPMGRWLRGPLREWAENQLSEDRLRREGFFQADEMRGLWHEHVHGGRERGLMLWAILVFQAWYESF